MGSVDVCVKIGRRIRSLRADLQLSQTALADLAGLSRVNLSRIERGAAEPGCRTLQAIAHALGLTLGELMQGLD